MTTLLQDYKKNNPQDAEVPDGALAYILWEKDYKGNADDPVSLEQYADAVGLDASQTQEMLSFSNKADIFSQQQQQQEPEEQTEEDFEASFQQRALKFTEGATFGWGDELFASVAAVDDVLTEGKDWSKAYSKYQSEYQAKMDDYATKAPLESLAFELVGGFAVPFGVLKTPKVMADLVRKGGTTGKLAASSAVGSAGGASYGAGSSDPGERMQGAMEGGAFGFGVGAAGQVIFNKVANAKTKNILKASVVKPTYASLEAAKNKAYKAVDDSGVKFSKGEIEELYNEIQQDITANVKSTYDPAFHTKTKLALDTLKRKIDEGNPLTLSQIETSVKRHFNDLYNSSNGVDTMILQMLNKVDDKIEKKFANNQDNVVQVARLANTRFKKFEEIEKLFKKAETTASAVPTITRYREVIAKLLNNERSMKFYSDEEKRVMQSFVKGSFNQNLLKSIGKFAPSSNGLMSLLHVGAIVAQPGLAAVTAGAIGARKIADKSIVRGAEDLKTMIGSKRPGDLDYKATAADMTVSPRYQGLAPNAVGGLLGGMASQ
jgi:hypothetical protein